MNYPPYSNDPNDPHSQPTTAGSYPQWSQQPGQPPQYPQQPGQPSYPQWGQPDPTTAGSYPQWGQQPPSQFPQQPGQFPQSGQNFPQYAQQYPQPGQFGVPPQEPVKPTFKQRFRAMSPWKRFGTIGCGTIIASILLCSLCAIVGNALPAPPKQPSTADTSQASPTDHQVDSIKTSTPTPRPTETPTPTTMATPTPSPTPKPAPTQAPVQQQQSVQQPIQQSAPQPTPTPTPAPTQAPAPTPTPHPSTMPDGAPWNPWGYDFESGNTISSPPSDFCSYFKCINNFPNGKGYVMECKDAMYSKSGGVSGSCSSHGGNNRTLYSH